MRTAHTAFTHLDRSFKVGDEVADDDPMVLARPDLFDGGNELTDALANIIDAAERHGTRVAPDQPSKRARTIAAHLERAAVDHPELADAIRERIQSITKPPAKRSAKKKADQEENA